MDATKNPKQIDLALGRFGVILPINIATKEKFKKSAEGKGTLNAVGGNILKGVYKLQGKQLIYCISAPGKARPKTFTITKGSGETLVKLKRFSTGEAKIEAALTKLGGSVRKDDIGWITSVSFKNAELADNDLKLFGKLSKLTSISIVNSPFTDADLSQFKDIHSLHHLNLTGTQVTGDGLLYLRKLTKLWTLHVSDTPVAPVN